MEEPADERVASIRRRLTADLALAADDFDAVGRVVGEMLRHPDDVVSARLLDVQRQQRAGLDENEAKGLLLALAIKEAETAPRCPDAARDSHQAEPDETDSVVDRLHARRERFDQSIVGGHGTMSYHEGRILHTEVTSGQMASLRDDVDAALVWIEVNGAANPIVLDDTTPTALRDHVQSGRTDMLDATILAIANDRLLVCDDLYMRSMHRSLGGMRSTWLHDVLIHAHVAGSIESERFTQQTTDLIGAGQDHLGVTGMMMALAVQMDVLEHDRIGDRAKALIGRLDGEIAEALSHLHAACEAMHHLWPTQSVVKVREAATGLILENLLKGRQGDWSDLLQAVERFVARMPDLRRYIRDWGRGHFLPGYC